MNTETKMKLPSVKMVLFIGLAIFLVGYLAAAKPDVQEEGAEFGISAPKVQYLSIRNRLVVAQWRELLNAMIAKLRYVDG